MPIILYVLVQTEVKCHQAESHRLFSPIEAVNAVLVRVITLISTGLFYTEAYFKQHTL